ncbi:B3 domain-containing protein Os12g0592300-like isoform X3 [Typha latifolia]|uniref:B3 domain-containing protein Os12g0592300-like isoform X3 n=2 Tax=Typha latifolia TaxID=4733 RepID=UPI003C30D2C4
MDLAVHHRLPWSAVQTSCILLAGYPNVQVSATYLLTALGRLRPLSRSLSHGLPAINPESVPAASRRPMQALSLTVHLVLSVRHAMHGGCESCKEWEEHFYWNHLDKTRMHFFKVMMSDFARSVTIPKKFSNLFKGVISETVHLKAPSGEVWDVGVTKCSGNIALQSGWKDFVRAHCIEESDLLVFKYSGNSCFDILIFDASGCEKATSFLIKKKDSQKKEKSDDYVEIINKPIHHEVLDIYSSSKSEHGVHIALQPQKSSSACHERVDIDQELDSCLGERDVKRNEGISLHPKKAIGRPRKDVGTSNAAMCDDKQESLESNEHEITKNVGYFISRKVILTNAHEEKVRQLALAIQLGNPFFVAVMRRTNVSFKNGFLNIPMGFAVKHLPPSCREIILRTPKKNNKWRVSVLLTKQTRGLHGSWKYFVRDNKLKEEDVCLFELMRNQKEITMVVHL